MYLFFTLYKCREVKRKIPFFRDSWWIIYISIGFFFFSSPPPMNICFIFLGNNRIILYEYMHILKCLSFFSLKVYYENFSVWLFLKKKKKKKRLMTANYFTECRTDIWQMTSNKMYCSTSTCIGWVSVLISWYLIGI